MGSGPVGLPDHPPGVLSHRYESRNGDRPRPSLRHLLLPPRLFWRPPPPFRPTATAPSLWELLMCGFRQLTDVPSVTMTDLDACGAVNFIFF